MTNRHYSPIDLRDGLESEALEPYQPPRSLIRQSRVKTEIKQNLPVASGEKLDNDEKQKKRWLPKLVDSKTGQSSLRQRISRGIARLSSLESTRSSSSIELDSVEQQNRLIQQQQVQQQRRVMPLISITSNDYEEEEDDEDDDAFGDFVPYSSSISRASMMHQPYGDVFENSPRMSNIEELFDDRQGMNSSEQQFTKAEKANRPSLDGSINSEFRMDSKKTPGKGSSKKDKRRSKFSSSSSITRRSRQSRRGFLGLASRLKLTKKHESIATLQLSILNRFVSVKTLDKDLQSFLPRERMSIREFENRVKLMGKYEVLSAIEYRFASKYETYVCKHALQESNQAKNNYKKCIPYDYNRVVLKTLPNVPDSDYINASHVDSCLKPNAYIAAQGPNENTIEDFWRMIWEQKTFVVVMLTKVFDFIRVMCNQYWPVELNKPERYGNLEVTLLYEEPLADFVIRTIRLTKLKENQKENVADDNKEEPGNNVINTDTADKHSDIGDADEDNEDYDLSDDTSYSDDGFEDETIEFNKLSGSIQNLTVRAPKFIESNKTYRRRERSASPRLERKHSSTSAINLTKRRGSDVSKRNNTNRPQPPNEFLHPLFSATHTSGSKTAPSPSEPGTPLSARTPGSAGLDRSSATRKAVKKKRRTRVKNQRPRRTQFMVPSESQLQDDNDDDVGTDDATGKVSDRVIYQFHYNSWASHTCPFISSLLHFRRRVRICMDEMSKSGKTGPTVVHCNDGCGRTGAYLCIDANLELAEEDNVIDIYNYSRKMRQSRKFLIENLEQYKFVYDTIEEAMFCGKTWFPLSELHKRLKHKSQRNPLTKKNEYLQEYEKICRMTSKFSIGDCAGGHRVENREKNRDVSTVPPDNFRPYLTSFQTNDSTDYINAVFVDGYTRSKEYIVTEWPLHRTISDFWSLVYDHDCNSVILLANPAESSTYPSFLPSEKELRRKFGPVFSAEMVSYTHYQNIKSWIYTINKKIVSLTEVIAGVKSEAKTTQVFQITCWPQGHRVPTSTNALVELMNMVERWRQRTTYGPVCVVSLNGKSRAGVYCAANVAIEQVVQHSEVDVFQAVKTVRRHRPQLIENMTEYKYCYDLILHYVLHYVNNQNAARG